MALSRRELLTGTAIGVAGLLGLSACDNAPARPRVPTPDERAREAAVSRERALLTAYDERIAAEGGASESLRLLRAHHADHIEALRTGPDPTPTPPGAASPAGTGSPPPPARRSSAAGLPAAERALADAHVAALGEVGPQLALLLGSAAASARAAAVVLERPAT